MRFLLVALLVSASVLLVSSVVAIAGDAPQEQAPGPWDRLWDMITSFLVHSGVLHGQAMPATPDLAPTLLA